MKIHDVFTNDHKSIDSAVHQNFKYFSFKSHDVIIKGIVPLSNEFNDTKAFSVIDKENFDVKCVGTEMIPLWMNQMIVNGVLEIKFAVFSPVKGGFGILACGILIEPSIMRF